MSSLKARRAIGIDIADTLIYTGAQSVIAPLWCDEASSLSTVLITAKFYDDVVDCADEMRPVSCAMRHASLWLRDATFANIRSFMWASRIDRLLLEEIDDELWGVALAQKMLKGAGNFNSTDDRWDRVQKGERAHTRISQKEKIFPLNESNDIVLFHSWCRRSSVRIAVLLGNIPLHRCLHRSSRSPCG